MITFPSNYTCVSCGARYCCVKCLGTHQDTRWVNCGFLLMPILSALYEVDVHSAKKVPGHLWKFNFTKKLYIRQSKSLLCKPDKCPLHFDTKLEGSVDK